MSYGNLTGRLSAADEAAIRGGLQTGINIIKPITPSYTPEERQQVYKMGQRRIQLAGESWDIAQQFPNLVPPIVNMPDTQDDYEAAKQFDGILNLAYELIEYAFYGRLARGSEVMTKFVKPMKGYIDFMAAQGDAGAQAAKRRLDEYYDLPERPDGDTENPVSNNP